MENLKQVVKFGIEVSHVIDKALVDKKIELHEFLPLIPLFLKSQSVFVNINQVSKEWNESSFEQKQSLIKEIEQSLDLNNDKLEHIIEGSLSLLLNISNLYKVVKG